MNRAHQSETYVCVESLPRQEEGSTGKYQHEVDRVPEGAARGNSWDRTLVFFCTPRLESRYRHYQIYKSDEAEAIVIALAMFRAIAMFKPSKKENQIGFFLVWWNNTNKNQFSLSIIHNHSMSHSYDMANSLIISVAKAKLFPKLYLQAKF